MTSEESTVSEHENLWLERLRNKAKALIGEKDELIPSRLEQLKAIIVSENDKINLHPHSYNEFYLRCIRAKKYDLARAAKLYKKFCMLKHGNPDMICKLVPSSYEKLYQRKLSSILVSRDTLGRQIFIVRAEKWDPKEATFEDFLSCCFLLLHEIVASIDTQLHGIVIIGDLKGLSLSHVKLIRPGMLQAMVSVFQDSYPARFKEIHAFNNPYIFNIIFALCKPFFKEKIRKRIHFHGHDPGNLHNALSIDPDLLPEFLGGKVAENEYADNSHIQSLVQKDDYFQDLFKYG